MNPRFSFSRFLLFVFGLWVLVACTPVTPTLLVVTEEPGAPVAYETAYPPPVTNTPTLGPYLAPSTSTPRPTENWNPPLDSTPKPITYSITSTENWSVYSNSEYGFSLKYPETPPKEQEGSLSQLKMFSLTIRTGPTVPRSFENVAVFEIHIYHNSTNLSFQDVISNIIGPYEVVAETNNPLALSSQQTLYAAGADNVLTYKDANGSRLLFAISHNEYVFILGEGLLTANEAQTQVFELLISTIQFH